ncbi:hypothetical protein GCM10009737_08130 [Nocardioides lentus]|uniref:Uncharacterized protein n=1 Tax=Nocardioides lentus TaxID=338077 RepID=A0ABN2P183_9ACTN
MTLVDFLLARIAEDEADARAASPGPWSLASDDPEQVVAVDGIEVTDAFALSGPQTRATAAHIARHDPARVLAQCRAHRDVITVVSDVGWTGSYAVRDVVLGHLARAYRDHPDFDPAWLA